MLRESRRNRESRAANGGNFARQLASHEPQTGGGFIASLRRQIDVVVRAVQQIDPASICGVGMKNVAGRIFEEYAYAFALFVSRILLPIVIEGAFVLKLFRFEGNRIVIV